jgi:hypothetical protein
MQECDVPLQVLLRFLEDPLLEVDEVEGVRVVDLLGLEPLDEEGEVVGHLLAVEDAVDHVAAEQPHLNLVPGVGVYLGVLVDRLEDVGGGRPVGELQVVEGLLVDGQLVPALEVFYWHVLQHQVHLAVGILEHDVRLHVLLLQLAQELVVLWALRALRPPLALDAHLRQAFGLHAGREVLQQRVGVEEVGLEEVELGGQPFGVGEVGGVVVEELDGALLQVVRLADLEAHFLELPFEVLGLRTDGLLLEQVGARLVFGLHFAVEAVLLADGVVLLVLLGLLQLVVEGDVLLELALVVCEERVLDDVGEGHALLAVHHEDALEEVLQLAHLLLQLVLLRQSRRQAEARLAATALDLRLHVVAYFGDALPLKGYSANSMK